MISSRSAPTPPELCRLPSPTATGSPAAPLPIEGAALRSASICFLRPSAPAEPLLTRVSNSPAALTSSRCCKAAAANEVLAWNDSANTWGCASVSGVGGVTGTGVNGQVAYWTGTSTVTGENQLSTSSGGTGLDTSTAPNGTLLSATARASLWPRSPKAPASPSRGPPAPSPSLPLSAPRLISLAKSTASCRWPTAAREPTL